MYQEAIKKIKNSIFPIFYQVRVGNHINIGVSGTGFFIDNNGHFLTAHHVISGLPNGAKILYAGNVPHNSFQPVLIEEKVVNPEMDIYIGQVPKGALSPVSLSTEITEIGTSICLCGYPLAQIKLDPDGLIDLHNVRQYWQPTYAIDNATVKLHDRKYKGFLTQHASLKGMSGGPVFDMKGNVIGVDVASSTRKIQMKADEHMKVINGIVASINSIQEIIKTIPNK